MSLSKAQSEPLEGLELRKFTYRDLLEMERVGLFEDERIELLDGSLVAMSLTNPPHVLVVQALMRGFFQQLGLRKSGRKIPCAYLKP